MGNIQFNDGKILFVDNKIAFGSGCCCGGDCEFCAEGYGNIASITVTLPSLTNKTCSDCGDLSLQDWVITEMQTPTVSYCWGQLLMPDWCDGGKVEVAIHSAYIRVALFADAGFVFADWRKTYDVPIQCTALENEEIPLYWLSEGSGAACQTSETPSAYITI